MKYVFFILLSFVFVFGLTAQVPDLFRYQISVRDTSSQFLIESQVGIQVSILQGAPMGSSVYSETHSVTTNTNGLASFTIGSGSNQVGSMGGIDWGQGPFYLKVESDPSGGTNYSQSVTTQFLSVPYALYAKQTGSLNISISPLGDTLRVGTKAFVVIPDISESAFEPPYPAGYVHCGTDTTRVVRIKSVTNRSWMDRNLGSSAVASSSTDTAAYGSLFQWGRFAEGHQCRNSTTTPNKATTAVPNGSNGWDGLFITESAAPNDWLNSQDSTLWQGLAGINNPCPAEYRLPTSAEWDNERQSWSSQNAAGAFDSPLKLTLGGRRNAGTGVLEDVGTDGYYWSSTVNGTSSVQLDFTGVGVLTNTSTRASGNSVRCIRKN